ncbi:hypothetical protein [Catellatospora paridis]|uniref:hypothetical protein n=1 Tax=Catellatospora paridis TaxID=1617086 RepID=UPI0012D3B151|nr:hypothetical protein [Catellatospora paridis]
MGGTFQVGLSQARFAPQPSFLARVFEPAELVHGAIAAMAMSGLRRFTVEMGWACQPPPDAIVEHKTPGLVQGKTTGERRAMIELRHWGFVAVGGRFSRCFPGVSAAAPGPARSTGCCCGRVRDGRRPCPRYRAPPGAKLSQRLLPAGDHLLYGFVLSHTRRRPRR